MSETRAQTKPCPSCPDGNEWDSNGPTGRVCEECGGYAVVNMWGEKLTKKQWQMISETESLGREKWAP